MGIERNKLIVAGAFLVLVSASGCSSSSDSGQTAANVKLYVNELQPANKSTIADEAGEFDDWVEIYNAGAEAVNLKGFYVSDSAKNLMKYELPTGLSVNAGGFLLLWADGTPEQGAAHLSFKLSATAGDSLHLSDSEGSEIDKAKFDIVSTHDSWARHPDGTGAFSWCSIPTPGVSNSSAVCTASAGTTTSADD
jgi:hypothetical protein